MVGKSEFAALSTLVIDVHLEEVTVGSSTYIVWYYNGLAAKDFSIRVQNRYHQIQFQFDHDSAKRFKFTAPIITPASKGGIECEDLSLAGYTDQCVAINDSHVHYSHDTVGSLTLFAESRGPTGNGAVVYDPTSLKSDPQVTNTGDNA